MFMANKKALVESALFMANEPLSLKELSQLIEDEKTAKNIVEELKKELAREERGIILIESKEGYQLRVKPEYVPMVRHLTPYQDLNKGLLRVLALVAYKQPITQSEIVKVIGNRAYEYVKSLEGRGLIRAVKQSRTKALIATKEFASYFGLEKPEDAKKFFEKLNGDAKSKNENAKKESQQGGAQEETGGADSEEDDEEY